MSAEMDALKVAVADEDTVIQSAIVAFQGLAQQIADAAGDKTASLALADDVKTQAAALAAAIPAGTPSA
jgi:hypothetical protein